MMEASAVLAYFVDNPATTAASLSAIAALLSVVATWLGPRSAAKLAEKIRRKSEWEAEKRRMKLHVFATLMQERATMLSFEAVRMLNSIDFVFKDSKEVRHKWAELFEIYNSDKPIDVAERRSSIAALLVAIAADLGMTDELKEDDLHRVYYPNAHARADEIRELEQQQALNRMRPVEEAKPDLLAKFPPKPQ